MRNALLIAELSLREAVRDVVLPEVYDRQKHPFMSPPARHDDDALGLATDKDVATELRPSHQACTNLLHGLEPTQLPLQGIRHFLARWFFAGRWFGQQQARLEVGEPRRHHEVVGG